MSRTGAGRAGEKFRDLYMALGREMMHFFAVNLLPVVVMTVVCVLWFSMDATGSDRWILLCPIKSAMPNAIDCAPVAW